MPDIVVIRGGGTRQGEDVIDPLLTTVSACLARGRIELDAASGLQPIEMECLYRDGLLLGDMVEINDPLHIAPYYGILSRITHVATPTTLTTQLVVTILSDFTI